MIKKLFAGIAIGVGLFGFNGNIAEATIVPPTKPAIKQEVTKETQTVKPSTKQDIKEYQITHPDKEFLSKDDKVALINGKAPANTEIIIKVFGTTDLTRKNFNLDKLPNEKDYIEISSETIKAGNTGFFQKQLELVTGVNKVVINFEVDGVEGREFIIYVYEKAPTLNEMMSVIR